MGGQREMSCFPWQCTNSFSFPSPNNLFVSVTCIALVFFHGMGLPETEGLCSARHVEIYPRAVFIEKLVEQV